MIKLYCMTLLALVCASIITVDAHGPNRKKEEKRQEREVEALVFHEDRILG